MSTNEICPECPVYNDILVYYGEECDRICIEACVCITCIEGLDNASTTCYECMICTESYLVCMECLGSSSSITLIPLLGMLVSVSLGALILGLIQDFNPKGPIFSGIFGSCILAVILSGVRLSFKESQTTCKVHTKKITNSVSTKIGRLTIIHSHHLRIDRETGHEFRIGNKYFCTGCYGILVGTIISILIMCLYIMFNLELFHVPLIIIAIPICFIPIILKYSLMSNMKTPMRLLSNILLPLGVCFSSISLDYIYQDWLVNLSL
ncbi:MAG: hypothetical protein ACFE9L_08260, partial [Candidatus Hodarchaeota archaeon]